MCGIAGAVFWQPDGAPRDPLGVAERMTSALAHRGPDDHGLVRCGASHPRAPVVVFGHRRLAIIDLSCRARQPMTLAHRPLWLTYNGEIYNHAALRRELEAAGRTFVSASDSEVLLHGYDEWGLDLLGRLQGMFAFAIWDDHRQHLLLVRDRLGIKPLYVAEMGGGVLFASEIRALLASGLVPREIDPIGLDQFLAYQAVPAPRTLVRNVRLMAPGQLMVIGGGGRIETRAYWDLLDWRSAEGRDAGAQESRARVGQLLQEAMSAHLVSDVPVGMFLSGGIDSSALVALAAAAGAAPRTFTVTLPGAAEDEAAYARLVAAEFRTEHTEVPIGPAEAVAGVAEALASLDHPSGDGINTFLVARAVRAAGFKVALSGLGGDELFGGYPSFARLERLAGYASALGQSPRPARRVAAAAVKLVGRSVGTAKAAALLETGGSLPEAFPILRQLFAPADRAALLAPAWREAAAAEDPYAALLRDAAARCPDAGLMTLTSYAEARTYMHDVLLRDTDQMSMSQGLEVRVPLLDHRLVEYVMGLPDDAKRPGRQAKTLLRSSLPAALPAAAVNRRKQGFVLPLDRWMRAELRTTCEAALGADGLAGREMFDAAALGRLWQAFLAGNRRTSWSRLWTLVALGAWMRRHAVDARL